MPGSSEDRTRLIATTAERLRLAQIDLADEAPDVRRSQLAEKIWQSLDSIAAGERSDFLLELRRRFPTWDGPAEPSAPERGSVAPETPVVTEQPSLPTEPAEAAAELLRLALNMTPEQRRDIARQLHPERDPSEPQPVEPDQPLEPGAPIELDDAALQALRAALQMKGEESPDVTRLLRLASQLCDFATSLYQLTWATWRTIAPQSSLRRSGGLQRTMARFAAGDPQVDADQVAGELDRLRQLIASLVSAIGQAGQQFASAHFARFAPGEIENAVMAESPGGLMSFSRNRQAQCWAKYVELSDMLDQSFIETEIRRVIAEHAEQLMRGLRGMQMKAEAEKERPGEQAAP